MYYGGGDLTPTSDDRTMAALAHGLSLFGFLPPLIIYLVKKDASRFVGFHALQALFFHLLLLGVLFVGWFVTILLTAVLIGLLLWPVMIALSFAPIVFAIIAAVKASNGEWYEYPLAGRWARSSVGV
jgi:hypothetical protein